MSRSSARWWLNVCRSSSRRWAATAISQRTRKALAEAKARGTTREGKPFTPGNAKMIADMKAAAAERDAALRETLRPMIGLSSRAIAERLKELSIAAPRGGAWSHETVQRVMARPGW
jgi:DNA invertase Pin-like site-specific DNA recombinase